MPANAGQQDDPVPFTAGQEAASSSTILQARLHGPQELLPKLRKGKQFREAIKPASLFTMHPPPVTSTLLVGRKTGTGMRTTAVALSERLTRQDFPNARVFDDPFCAAIGPCGYCRELGLTSACHFALDFL